MRRYRPHYDVTVMHYVSPATPHTLKLTARINAFSATLYQHLTLLSTHNALIKVSSVNKHLLKGVNKGVRLTPVFRVQRYVNKGFSELTTDLTSVPRW